MNNAMNVSLLFSRVASHYDIANHMLSLNFDRVWRKQLAREVYLPGGARVLDLCTGTGDVAIEFGKRKETAEIIGVDFSKAMLSKAEDKIKKYGLETKIRMIESDIFELSLAGGSFDAVSIAFGLRNLYNYEKGIVEMARMLKTGGYAAILEFSPASDSALAGVYNFYLTHMVPRIGALFSGLTGEYGYLSSSIRSFLHPKDILGLMRGAGFKNLKWKRLTGGVVHLYIGQK
jgi:demethylmenaquinone methyltransferase/2-methoxy-6-polyprenyl-1,4-benzoquinol methylase